MKERIFIKRAKEQIKLEEFLRKEFADIKCGLMEIAYTPLGVRIIVHTTSPGLVIGHQGDKIREVADKLKTQFGLENPQIDVQKITNPDMEPRIVSQSIAAALDRGMNPKKIGHYYIDRVMRAGAIGCEIIIKGKLGGEKSRQERFIQGYIKSCGEPAQRDVIVGVATALPKLGCIGVTTRIMITHSDKKIIVVRPAAKILQAEAAAVEEEKAAVVEPQKTVEVTEGEKK